MVAYTSRGKLGRSTTSLLRRKRLVPTVWTWVAGA